MAIFTNIKLPKMYKIKENRKEKKRPKTTTSTFEHLSVSNLYFKLTKSIQLNSHIKRRIEEEVIINTNLVNRCYNLYSQTNGSDYYISEEGRKGDIYQDAIELIDTCQSSNNNNNNKRLRNNSSISISSFFASKKSSYNSSCDIHNIQNMQLSSQKFLQEKINSIIKENLALKESLSTGKRRNENLRGYLKDLLAAKSYSLMFDKASTTTKTGNGATKSSLDGASNEKNSRSNSNGYKKYDKNKTRMSMDQVSNVVEEFYLAYDDNLY